MLKIENISKIYQTQAKDNVTALQNIDLTFDKNSLTFIVGQSGSGKTTLLNLIGGLDSQTKGIIKIDDYILGDNLTLETYRQNYIGFVFQDYNLLEHLTVFDNIALAISPCSKNEIQEKVLEVLEQVELVGYEKRKINELSGGQKQRVAIARALAKNSVFLLCDEPTGSLDSKTSKEIFNLLKKISLGKIVIVVSHNEELSKEYADRILKIEDGKIVEDTVIVLKNEIESNSTSDNKVVSNKVSFFYKIKLGFENLLTHKLKTAIAFILLLLSVISMCAMQICLSYNSERNISNSLDDEKTIIVVHNSDKNGVSNTGSMYPLEYDLSKVLNQEQFRNGYLAEFGTIFLINDDLKEKEFYFKRELTENAAYVTDYFVNFVINAERTFSQFEKLTFADYTELENIEVVYNGVPIFTIAGIIKTDYADYTNNNGELKDNSKDELSLNEKNSYSRIASYKMNYDYKVIYTIEDTFNSMPLGGSAFNYSSQSGYKISIEESNNDKSLSNINLYDCVRNPIEYYDNTGYLKTTSLEMQADEIIINGDLYNSLFKSSKDWFEFKISYEDAIYNGKPLINALENLGKTIDLQVKDKENNIVLDIKNKKIIGVATSNKPEELAEMQYLIYGTNECFGFENIDTTPHFATEVILNGIENKQEFFKELRIQDVLIAGAKSSLVYGNEYIINQMSYFLMGIAVIFTIITFIATFNLVNAKIRDKEKEIGILMGIGFRNKEICFIYLFSILIMTLMALIINIVVMYSGVFIINMVLQVSPFTSIEYFAVDLFTYLSMLAVGIVIMLASLIPIILLSKKKPIEIIRK